DAAQLKVPSIQSKVSLAKCRYLVMSSETPASSRMVPTRDSIGPTVASSANGGTAARAEPASSFTASATTPTAFFAAIATWSPNHSSPPTSSSSQLLLRQRCPALLSSSITTKAGLTFPVCTTSPVQPCQI